MNMPEKFMVGITDSVYRPCMVGAVNSEGEFEVKKALFHKWITKTQGAVLGKFDNRTIKTVALVELESGHTDTVEPEFLRFLDTGHMMEQVAWEEC